MSMVAKPGIALRTVLAANKARPLAEHGGDRPEQPENIRLEYGTGADYLTARIARDHPEILERMKAGELSKELEKAQGRRDDIKPLPPSGRSQTKADVLADAGLSPQQAHRCETIYRLHIGYTLGGW